MISSLHDCVEEMNKLEFSAGKEFNITFFLYLSKPLFKFFIIYSVLHESLNSVFCTPELHTAELHVASVHDINTCFLVLTDCE